MPAPSKEMEARTEAEKDSPYIKPHTSVTGVWLCQRLSMGGLSNLSRALARFRSAKEGNVKRLKRDMKRCKGCTLYPFKL